MSFLEVKNLLYSCSNLLLDGFVDTPSLPNSRYGRYAIRGTNTRYAKVRIHNSDGVYLVGTIIGNIIRL